MDIKIKNISDYQKHTLEQLEESIISVIRSSGFPLNVRVGFAVADKKGLQAFEVSDNASFSIKGSFEIKNRVVDVLKKAELDSLIPDYAVVVKLNFEKKDVNVATSSATEEKKKEAVNDDDTLQQFIPVSPKYSFDQIILPDELRREIFDAIKLLECKDLIYNTWGYGAIEPVAKSILNMHGPAGTGKTMCAHAIANKLGKKLLALNYSEIESKYVGDAAKNLKNAFDAAKKSDSVMFFDEADSFLGKRIENVSQGSDQALNSLRSQMLILLEEHNGVVLFATNLVSNFDPAFNSRIQKHIKFDLPNKEARIAIIKKQIPVNLPIIEPISDDDFAKASDFADGFNGREIKNAMLNLYLSKADVNNPDVFFTGEDICNTMKAKKEEKEKLEAERKEKLKLKIATKLAEKAEEDNAVKEYEDKKKAEKEAENLKDNVITPETTDNE